MFITKMNFVHKITIPIDFFKPNFQHETDDYCHKMQPTSISVYMLLGEICVDVIQVI